MGFSPPPEGTAYAFASAMASREWHRPQLTRTVLHPVLQVLVIVAPARVVSGHLSSAEVRSWPEAHERDRDIVPSPIFPGPRPSGGRSHGGGQFSLTINHY